MSRYYYVNDDEGLQIFGKVDSDPGDRSLDAIVEYAWQAGKDGVELQDLDIGIREMDDEEVEKLPEL